MRIRHGLLLIGNVFAALMLLMLGDLLKGCPSPELADRLKLSVFMAFAVPMLVIVTVLIRVAEKGQDNGN